MNTVNTFPAQKRFVFTIESRFTKLDYTVDILESDMQKIGRELPSAQQLKDAYFVHMGARASKWVIEQLDKGNFTVKDA